MRDLRTKGPQEQRSLQSLLAALWTCSESGPIFATRSDEWYVGGVEWSEKRCLGPTREAALPKASNKR